MSTRRDLAEVLTAARDEIATSWAARVQKSSQRYRRQPIEEIEERARHLIDGLIDAVGSGDFTRLEERLHDLAQRRSSMGFDPSEVQGAFLMGCEAAFPALERAFGGDAQRLVWSLNQIERTIHRSLDLLGKALGDAHQESLAASVEDAVGEGDTAERRLQAIAGALGFGAIVVGPDLTVRWVDARAASPEYGMVTPGERHTCGSCRQEEGADECLLTLALESGEVHQSEPGPLADVWLAVPIKSESGEVVEVVGLMGGPMGSDA